MENPLENRATREKTGHEARTAAAVGVREKSGSIFKVRSLANSERGRRGGARRLAGPVPRREHVVMGIARL